MVDTNFFKANLNLLIITIFCFFIFVFQLQFRTLFFNGEDKITLQRDDGEELTFMDKKCQEASLTYNKTLRRKSPGVNESEKKLGLNFNHRAHQKGNFGQKDASIVTHTSLKYTRS